MYKDKDVTTIINGKALRDRKQTITGFSQTYSISLDRLKNLTISVKQAKAVHNKAKGITICAYNKVAEIEGVGERLHPELLWQSQETSSFGSTPQLPRDSRLLQEHQ